MRQYPERPINFIWSSEASLFGLFKTTSYNDLFCVNLTVTVCLFKSLHFYLLCQLSIFSSEAFLFGLFKTTSYSNLFYVNLTNCDNIFTFIMIFNDFTNHYIFI